MGNKLMRFSLATLVCLLLLVASVFLAWPVLGEWKLVRRLNCDGDVACGAFSSDGSTFAVGMTRGEAWVWREEETPVSHVKQTGSIASLSLSSNGNTLAMGGSAGCNTIWNVNDGRQLGAMDTHAQVDAFSFSPDGDSVAGIGSKVVPIIWNLKSNERVILRGGHDLWATALDYGPDGTRVLTASADCSVCIWDAKTGKLVKRITPSTHWLMAGAFAPDMSKIATGGKDCILRVLDTEKGIEILAMAGHRGTIYHVLFSQDGNRVVSTAMDGTIRVWDVFLGKEVVCLGIPDSHLIAQSEQGGVLQVATFSPGKGLRIWRREEVSRLRLLSRHFEVWVLSCVLIATCVSLIRDRSIRCPATQQYSQQE